MVYTLSHFRHVCSPGPGAHTPWFVAQRERGLAETRLFAQPSLGRPFPNDNSLTIEPSTGLPPGGHGEDLPGYGVRTHSAFTLPTQHNPTPPAGNATPPLQLRLDTIVRAAHVLRGRPVVAVVLTRGETEEIEPGPAREPSHDEERTGGPGPEEDGAAGCDEEGGDEEEEGGAGAEEGEEDGGGEGGEEG